MRLILLDKFWVGLIPLVWMVKFLAQFIIITTTTIVINLLLEIFSHQRQLMVFNWLLSDSKSPEVFRTLLSILSVLNNVEVLMVSTRPLISKFFSLFNNPLVTVTKAPVMIGIIVTFMFLFFSIPCEFFTTILTGCNKLPSAPRTLLSIKVDPNKLILP